MIWRYQECTLLQSPSVRHPCNWQIVLMFRQDNVAAQWASETVHLLQTCQFLSHQSPLIKLPNYLGLNSQSTLLRGAGCAAMMFTKRCIYCTRIRDGNSGHLEQHFIEDWQTVVTVFLLIEAGSPIQARGSVVCTNRSRVSNRSRAVNIRGVNTISHSSYQVHNASFGWCTCYR